MQTQQGYLVPVVRVTEIPSEYRNESQQCAMKEKSRGTLAFKLPTSFYGDPVLLPQQPTAILTMQEEIKMCG